MALESKFQQALVAEIKNMFPGCFVMKNDEQYIQGVPDLTILFGRKWAVLEVKRSFYERYQPNQEYYLDYLDEMSFAGMVCPENKDEILRHLYEFMCGNDEV